MGQRSPGKTTEYKYPPYDFMSQKTHTRKEKIISQREKEGEIFRKQEKVHSKAKKHRGTKRQCKKRKKKKSSQTDMETSKQ